MLSKAYKRVLLGISISISLLLLASPASAMCFYNKMNPSDFKPDGYNLSQNEKAVGFDFQRDGLHLDYIKNVSINQHQCIGGGAASVSLHLMGYHLYESYSHVDPHGYVVVETEPSDLSTASVKYFKIKMSVYSQSNALHNSYTRNMRCSLYSGISGSPFLRCRTI